MSGIPIMKSSPEVLKQLNWLTLNQRRAWNKVKLVMKCTQFQTQSDQSDVFARQNSNRSRNTRNNDFFLILNMKVRTIMRKEHGSIIGSFL